MKKALVIFTFILFINSCNSKLEDESIFPKVKDVAELAKTDFSPTLESSFNTKKNIIYGATIPFAWNDIRNEIDGLFSNFSSKQLEDINNTKSYVNVLNKDEYETSIKVNGTEISAQAYFKKSLPFKKPLTKFNKPLVFNKSKVETFGFYGCSSIAKINYYNSEKDFSITLFPENKAHEIILIMCQKRKTNFQEYFSSYNQEKELAKNRSIHFNDYDKIEIPIIEFNLEKSFNNIIESSFNSSQRKFEITELYQRNAFILNEKGAEVESEVEFALDEAEEIERTEPKMMIFNQPFVVFLKRKDAKFPYFGIYISNEELLKQRKSSL